MFKSTTIPWKGLAATIILSLLVVACAPAAQSPTTGSSELATPASGTGAEQVPTAEVGQAQTQPTESVAQAPTTEAATEAPTTEAATTEAPTTAAVTEAPTTAAATEAPTTAAAPAAPTVAATAASTATPEPTVASSAAVTATTPAATAVSTPSTLPVTGASDDGTAALSFALIALGVVLLLGVLGLAFARREQ